MQRQTLTPTPPGGPRGHRQPQNRGTRNEATTVEPENFGSRSPDSGVTPSSSNTPRRASVPPLPLPNQCRRRCRCPPRGRCERPRPPEKITHCDDVAVSSCSTRGKRSGESGRLATTFLERLVLHLHLLGQLLQLMVQLLLRHNNQPLRHNNQLSHLLPKVKAHPAFSNR